MTDYRQPTPYQAEALTPAITSTVLITLFFGLFGLIPAVSNTNRARALGVHTNKYWKAFWITMGIGVAAWIVVIVALAAGGNAAVNDYNQSVDHVSNCINGSTVDADGNLVWPAGCEDVAG